MRTGQVVYTVALTLIVLTTVLVLGFPYLAANPEDRQAILSVGSTALGVLVTLGSQAFFTGDRPVIAAVKRKIDSKDDHADVE